MASDSRPRLNETWLMVLFALLNFSHIVDFMIIMPLGPSFMRIFDLDPRQFGWLVSAYAVSAGASGLLAALYIDRFDRKRSLLFFYSGFALATFLCAMSEGYTQLLLARSFAGAFGGVIVSVIMSIVSDVTPYSRRGQAMGIVTTGFSMASIFGVPFGLYLAQKFDWHSPFLTLSGFSVVLLILSAVLVPNVRGHIPDQAARPFAIVQETLHDRAKVIALLFMICLVFGQFTVIPFISPSLVLNAGLKEEQLPLMYLIGGLFSIVAGPVVGRLADRFGKHKVFVGGALLSIIPMFLITTMGLTPLPIILLITSCFFITMSGRMVPAMAMVSASSRPEGRGGFMSFISAFQQFSAAGSAALAGWIIVEDQTRNILLNYDKVGILATVFTFFAVVLNFKLINRELKGQPQ
jgi:MFS transporter, DHA1 family, inner membrane transport protein